MPVSNSIRLEGDNVPVMIQDQISPPVELYMYIDSDPDPNIAVNTSMNDRVIQMDDATGVLAGWAITIFEGIRTYQSIITAVVGNDVSVATPLDFAFTTAADVHVGDWKLNKDGSTNIVSCHQHGPAEGYFDIYQISVGITDATVMDSSKFGGIPALTNGIFFRFKSGVTYNLPSIVNNLGFSEYGFSVTYDAKSPAGVYGLRASKNYKEVNGIALRIGAGDRIELDIQDDLTGLTGLNCTINGHVVV